MADRSNRLAAEHMPPASARGVGAVLLLAVALTVAVNQLAVHLSPAAERTYDGMVVARKWELAERGAPEGGVVVIGDSSGNFAVDAGVLAAELGVPAVNLCAYGRFQVSGAAWFLDEALARGATPSTVLVVLGARTFVLDPSGDQFAQVPVALLDWDRRLPGAGLDARRALEFLRARALPLFDQAPSFEQAALNGVWRVDPDVLAVEENGTTRLPFAVPGGVAPFAKRYLEEIRDLEGPVPSARERRAVEALVADADARGYDLVFVDGPIWKGLVDEPDQVRLLERVHGFLDEACAASPRARRLDVPLQTFPAAQMENPFHIVEAASKRFTRRLAAALEGR